MWSSLARLLYDSFQFHWMDSFTVCTRTPSQITPFNSIEWIHRFYPCKHVYAVVLTFNSIEWILARPRVSEPEPCDVERLSIPLNGFVESEWRSGAKVYRLRLSIPLNGFVTACCWGGSRALGLSIPLNGFPPFLALLATQSAIPFNSIEWILYSDEVR